MRSRTKWYASASSAYFRNFLLAAHSGVWVVPLRYDGAKVSVTVTSHASALPDFLGTIVRPSRRLRLRFERSHGSFIKGTTAAERDLWMISFMIWCLAIFLHPCGVKDHASRSDQPFCRMGKDALRKVAGLVGVQPQLSGLHCRIAGRRN